MCIPVSVGDEEKPGCLGRRLAVSFTGLVNIQTNKWRHPAECPTPITIEKTHCVTL